MHLVRIVSKRLRCGQLHRIKAGPKAVLIAKGAQAALGGYTRPSECKDVHQRIRWLILIQSQAAEVNQREPAGTDEQVPLLQAAALGRQRGCLDRRPQPVRTTKGNSPLIRLLPPLSGAE